MSSVVIGENSLVSVVRRSGNTSSMYRGVPILCQMVAAGEIELYSSSPSAFLLCTDVSLTG